MTVLDFRSHQKDRHQKSAVAAPASSLLDATLVFVEDSKGEGSSGDEEPDSESKDSKDESASKEADEGPRSSSGRLSRPVQKPMNDFCECQHFQGTFGDQEFASDERVQVARNQTPERDDCLRVMHSLQALQERNDMVNDFALTQCSLRQGL